MQQMHFFGSWTRITMGVTLAAASALAFAGTLNVAAPEPSRVTAYAEASTKQFSKNAENLTRKLREDLARAGRFNPKIPFAFPVTIRPSVSGQPLPLTLGLRGPGLSLQFDNSGSGVFPTAYRQLLEDTFTACENELDLFFGIPNAGGNVFVRNFDDTIGDRDAVTGGYFVANNGLGQAEIRFPVYTNPEAAVVNFIHCLLLAYIGNSPYGFDAFQEGLVRAATMRIVRTSGALPAGLDTELIEQVLDNTYDVGLWYDWYNQRGLGGPIFIAPNLRNTQLPSGGSLGGIYLLRYQMAGSAWQKLVAETPAFIPQFNARYYTAVSGNPSVANDISALVNIGQSALDAATGVSNATVEGYSFSEWFKRQFILDTELTVGPKLVVQPVPITNGLSGTDYGVFLVQATYFETLFNGNETLLSGVSFPIFWDNFFSRIFPSAQEDRMDIGGAYGAVVPNLPDLNAGEPYRATIDIPVQDRVARAYVPAGTIATASNPTPNDLYGTVTGLSLGTGVTARVRFTYGATTVDNITIKNGAFGARINNSAYLNYQRCKAEVVRTQSGLDTVVLTRFVNKGPGPLALDLRIGVNGMDDTLTWTPAGGLPKGIRALGFPVEPFSSSNGSILGLLNSQVLAARYNPSKAKYDLYPDCGAFSQGMGYFVRQNFATPGFSVTGRGGLSVPTLVALRPGWNLIANPLNSNVPTSQIRIVRAAEFPKSYADALGSDIGINFFEFVPGANDAATGAPETGAYTAATQFEPGKAYFVRVLAPEGVSMLFEPSGSTDGRAAALPNLATGWKMKVTFKDGARQSVCFIGGEPNASKAFEPQFDSPLPPQFANGVQVYSEGGGRQFQDVRKFGQGETFFMRADGLTPGKRYTYRFEFVQGSLPNYVFVDPSAVIYKTWSGTKEYSFTALQKQKRIEIRINGGG